MNELEMIKNDTVDIIQYVLEDDPDIRIDDIYEEVLMQLCGKYCGDLDCHFCPLDTLEKFEIEFDRSL